MPRAQRRTMRFLPRNCVVLLATGLLTTAAGAAPLTTVTSTLTATAPGTFIDELYGQTGTQVGAGQDFETSTGGHSISATSAVAPVWSTADGTIDQSRNGDRKLTISSTSEFTAPTPFSNASTYSMVHSSTSFATTSDAFVSIDWGFNLSIDNSAAQGFAFNQTTKAYLYVLGEDILTTLYYKEFQLYRADGASDSLSNTFSVDLFLPAGPHIFVAGTYTSVQGHGTVPDSGSVLSLLLLAGALLGTVHRRLRGRTAVSA